MKELRLPLDFSSTLFKIINLYYSISNIFYFKKEGWWGVKVVRLGQMRRTFTRMHQMHHLHQIFRLLGHATLIYIFFVQTDGGRAANLNPQWTFHFCLIAFMCNRRMDPYEISCCHSVYIWQFSFHNKKNSEKKYYCIRNYYKLGDNSYQNRSCECCKSIGEFEWMGKWFLPLKKKKRQKFGQGSSHDWTNNYWMLQSTLVLEKKAKIWARE